MKGKNEGSVCFLEMGQQDRNNDENENQIKESRRG